MKQSPLNPKPIKCTLEEAYALMAGVIKEYLQNETIEERIKGKSK